MNFSHEDMSILRDVVAREKARRQNREIGEVDTGLPSKPEVYIAYPQDTITAAVLSDPIVGTIGAPGYGECDIYQIIGDGSEALIYPVGFHKTVYNLTESEISTGPISVKRDKYGKWMADTGGECSSRNEVWHITEFGTPTGGSFIIKSLTINGVAEDITIAYNSSSSSAQTAILGHSELVTGDVEVTGGPFPASSLLVEFKGLLAGTAIGSPFTDVTNLTGGTTPNVILARYQPGYPN